MKTWECKEATHTNQSPQWNQGAKECHLSGGSSEILFTSKESNIQIRQYSVGISSLVVTC
jgi:hypothetical protein